MVRFRVRVRYRAALAYGEPEYARRRGHHLRVGRGEPHGDVTDRNVTASRVRLLLWQAEGGPHCDAALRAQASPVYLDQLVLAA